MTITRRSPTGSRNRVFKKILLISPREYFFIVFYEPIHAVCRYIRRIGEDQIVFLYEFEGFAEIGDAEIGGRESLTPTGEVILRVQNNLFRTLWHIESAMLIHPEQRIPACPIKIYQLCRSLYGRPELPRSDTVVVLGGVFVVMAREKRGDAVVVISDRRVGCNKPFV